MRRAEREQRDRSAAGFTLVEVLVVIVILGILAAVVVFATGGIADRGQESACAIEERSIRTAVESYRSVNGATALPTNTAGLVPDFLSEEPQLYYQLQVTGDDTYDVVPLDDSPCTT